MIVNSNAISIYLKNLDAIISKNLVAKILYLFMKEILTKIDKILFG